MKSRTILTILVYLLSFSMNLHAQFIINLLDTTLYDARVKLVDEFIDRFDGKDIRKEVLQRESRAKDNLMLLFNYDIFSSPEDSLFKEANIFADKIMSDSITINYSDSTWFAMANCHGKLSGKPVDFMIYLNVEERGKDMYKWVISKVEGNPFTLSSVLTKKDLFLYPDDHETNFMSLAKMTKEAYKYASCYTNKDYTVDQTSVFLTLIQYGILKIEHVTELEFLFLQVPGYGFTIKNIERESLNSGWLINSFFKMTSQEKKKFLNSMNHKSI